MTTVDLRTAIAAEIRTMRSRHKLERIYQLVNRLKNERGRQNDHRMNATELAELDRRYNELVSGRAKGHTRSESMRLARSGRK